MSDDCEPESVEDVLECVEEAGKGEERVSVSDIVKRIGDGAFAVKSATIGERARPAIA